LAGGIWEVSLASALGSDPGRGRWVVADFKRHLQACQPCVAFLNTYEKTRNLTWRGVPVEMPEEMKTRLRVFLLLQLTRGAS